MSHSFNLKKLSFLVYGLGATGNSVINYFKKKNISSFFVWDDNLRLLEPTTATLILFVSPAKNDVFTIIHLGRTELLKYTADFG